MIILVKAFSASKGEKTMKKFLVLEVREKPQRIVPGKTHKVK